MASSVVRRVRREKVMPLPLLNMKCIVCKKLLNEAITISLCRHSFCRKCLYEQLSDRGVNSCPICDIKLGCVLMDKLRPEQYLQDIRANIFPSKRRKVGAHEVPYSFSPLPMNNEISLSSLAMATIPIAPRQFSSILPPAAEKVATNRETLAIEWHECSAMKKRKLEEASSIGLVGSMKEVDYQSFWNLRTCHLIKSIIPRELSRGLMKKPLPEIFNLIMYYFANFFTGNRALDFPHLFDEIELYNKKQCGEFEQQLSNLRSDHDAKLKEQADFYEAELKRQAQDYDTILQSLEKEVAAKWKNLFDQNKNLEKELDKVKRCISVLEEVDSIPKLQEESHRAGMEEGVKRMVRAVCSVSPYINWDRIHIFENTADEDREALQQAFLEGISTAPPLAKGEDQGRIIML